MIYTKDELYDIFINQILGKKRIKIAGFAFNTPYNYRNHEVCCSVYVKKDVPQLQIKKSDAVKELLFQYINTYVNNQKKYTFTQEIDFAFGDEQHKIMYALTTLFINANYEDFEQMENYMRRRLDFLNSNLSEQHGNWKLAGPFEGVTGANIFYRVAENNYALETPERLEVMVRRVKENGETEEFHLPSITFGISGKTAHVYTIQNLHQNLMQSESLKKELNRAKFKLNKNVEPEHQNVEPFAIVSATVLSGFLKTLQVEKVQVNTFLPMRYHAKREASFIRSRNNPEFREELLAKQQHIQENLTEKFLKTFIRVEEQTASLSTFSDDNPSYTIFQNKQTKNTSEAASPFLTALHESIQHNQEHTM